MNPIDLHQIAVEAMRSRGLQPAFTPQALQEAEAARRTGPERNGAIRDLRHLTWFSIDNDDTRDLDQLSVAEPLPQGAARLLVAVADVDAMVQPGGAVDGHAGANTTSVYTAAGVFPMLPEALSTDLTSLHEGQDRLAVVVDMLVQADGNVQASEVYRAAVLNRAKLTYDKVSAWLDDGAAPPPQIDVIPGLEQQLRLHDALAGAPPPYDAVALAQIAGHCTLQEDNANKVERQVLKAAAAFLLHGRIGESFDAIVTGAAAKGTFVRIPRPMVEGRVVRGFDGLDVGDRVRVRLVAVDAHQGFIDFERA